MFPFLVVLWICAGTMMALALRNVIKMNDSLRERLNRAERNNKILQARLDEYEKRESVLPLIELGVGSRFGKEPSVEEVAMTEAFKSSKTKTAKLIESAVKTKTARLADSMLPKTPSIRSPRSVGKVTIQQIPGLGRFSRHVEISGAGNSSEARSAAEWYVRQLPNYRSGSLIHTGRERMGGSMIYVFSYLVTGT